MDKCKTCKHWKLPPDDEKFWRVKDICNPVDPDTFEPMKLDFEVKMCISDKIVWFERQPESTGVSLMDGSDWFSQMLTGEDFGCVNYAPA